MLKEHCFDRKYVIEPYGTIFATLVTKGLIPYFLNPFPIVYRSVPPWKNILSPS